MIRHCVFVKFRSDVGADERTAIYAGLGALVGQIEGLLSFESGPNISPEGRSRGFNDGFIMDFADTAARDRYLPHPAHKEAGSRLVARWKAAGTG